MKLWKASIAAALCFFLVVACSGSTPVATLSATPIASPAQALLPTPTLNFQLPSAAETAAAFVNALNQQDFVTAFTLLDAASRSELKDADALRREYNEVRATALAANMTAQIRGGLLQQDDRAASTLVSTWQSGLFGSFDVTSTLALVNEGDTVTPWRVAWSRDAIIPGLSNGVLTLQRNSRDRGSIFASDGATLATQAERVILGVQRGQIEDANEEAAMLNVLAQVTGVATDTLRSRYVDQPANWFAPVADVDVETLELNSALLSPFAAISARTSYTRVYPNKAIAPHVVGYVGFIPPEAIDRYRARGYASDEKIGLSGVEGGADEILGGTIGGELQLISRDSSAETLARRDFVRGRDVTLTISPTLQVAVQNLLGQRRGAAVVMRVKDGAVLAMASYPTFDPTAITTQHIRDGSLLNRAAQGLYPPGSTFKMVTMAAGIGEGLTDPEDVFIDPGFWDGYGEDFRKTCWLKTGHGQIDLQNGLTASCDVVFYEVGKRLEEKSPFTLGEYARKFGFGAPTGVEIASEVSGIVPDPDWKKAKLGESWVSGDTINLAIGQGYMLATPLQVTQMTAAIANGGMLNHAYVIADPRTPVRSTQLPLSPDTLKAIQDGMVGVTTNARYGTTTYRFNNFDYYFTSDGKIVPGRALPVRERRVARKLVIAGKSGTAEAGFDARPFAWFTAYAPADDPEIAVTVLLENIGEGSSFAAPVVRQIIESYYGLPVSPTPRDARTND
jgi:penicillin-binding protein 2